MNFQALPTILNDAYTMFDSAQLSVTSLVLIGAGLTLLLLFALRQAATWFFKIDDIKRDIRDVRQVVLDMEGEIRLLQGLLTQNVSLAKAAPKAGAANGTTTSAAAGAALSVHFPITH